MLARSDERGSALAEFMLVFMLVVTLFFAMFEFGLVLNSRLVLLAACRDGARRAAVEGGATAAVGERIRNQLGLGYLNPDLATVTIEPQTASYGTPIAVSIEYPYRFTTPVIRSLFGGQFRLKVTITSRSEHVR